MKTYNPNMDGNLSQARQFMFAIFNDNDNALFGTADIESYPTSILYNCLLKCLLT